MRYLLFFSFLFLYHIAFSQEKDTTSSVKVYTSRTKINNSPLHHHEALFLYPSGDFWYATIEMIDMPKGCGPPMPVKIVEGYWQKTDDAIILIKDTNFVTSPIKEIIIHDQTETDKILVQVTNRSGDVLPDARIRFYYKDSNDFIVLRTDRKGNISVPLNTYDRINVLEVYWKAGVVTFPIESSKGSKVSIVLGNLVRYSDRVRVNLLEIPDQVVLSIQEKNTLRFEDFNKGHTLKLSIP